MRDASSVLATAQEVRGMVPFFSLVGAAIMNGRSTAAYQAMTMAGLRAACAWGLIEAWQFRIRGESRTGWSPEAIAMLTAMDEVTRWRRVRWAAIASRCLVEGD